MTPAEMPPRWARALRRGAGWAILGAHTARALARSLRRRGSPAESTGSRPRSTPGGRLRILVVTSFPVASVDHGTAVRLSNLLSLAARRHAIELLIVGHPDSVEPTREHFEPLGVTVHGYPVHRVPLDDPWMLAPRTERRRHAEGLAAHLRELVRDHAIDLVQLEHAELGQYASSVDVPTVLTEHDLVFRSYRRRLRAGIRDSYFENTWMDWMRQLRYELRVCRSVDEVHVMSSVDARTLRRFVGIPSPRIRVVPNGVDVRRYHPASNGRQRSGVLFVGNFGHKPNVDAVGWLLSSVWPRIRARRRDATLSIVGPEPPAAISAADGRDGVRVLGRVPDLPPLYRSHRVLVAPIRAGSGTRLKILEAMACGTPVVSTAIGAEGIECTAGGNIEIADEAEAFGEKVAWLLCDDKAGEAIGHAGRLLVVERYDWERIAEVLLGAYDELVARAGAHDG